MIRTGLYPALIVHIGPVVKCPLLVAQFSSDVRWELRKWANRFTEVFVFSYFNRTNDRNKIHVFFFPLFLSIIRLIYVGYSTKMTLKCSNSHRLSDMKCRIHIGQLLYLYRINDVNWTCQNHKNPIFDIHLPFHIEQPMWTESVKIMKIRYSMWICHFISDNRCELNMSNS